MHMGCFATIGRCSGRLSSILAKSLVISFIVVAPELDYSP